MGFVGLGPAHRKLELQVRDLSVFHDDARVRPLDLDLVDDELAGEEPEELRPRRRLRRREERRAAAFGLDADVGEGDAERPKAEIELVMRLDPELFDDRAGLMGGEVARPLRPHEDAETDRNEAADR